MCDVGKRTAYSRQNSWQMDERPTKLQLYKQLQVWKGLKINGNITIYKFITSTDAIEIINTSAV